MTPSRSVLDIILAQEPTFCDVRTFELLCLSLGMVPGVNHGMVRLISYDMVMYVDNGCYYNHDIYMYLEALLPLMFWVLLILFGVVSCKKGILSSKQVLAIYTKHY